MPFTFELVVTRFGVHPGGTAATSAVGLLISDALIHESFSAGFESLKVDLHFRHERHPPRPFGPEDISRYHVWLDTFPKITQRKKAKRIEILYAASLPLNRILPYPTPNVSVFEDVAGEVMRALVALRARKPKSFDTASLIAKVESAIASVPREDAAFLKRIADAEEAARARYRAADPWSILDIDWTTYHRSARTLLDDPFFWDVADDHAPVGNDTGADILESYRTWSRRHKKDVSGALAYVEAVLEEWGQHETGDERALLVRDEAFIALAFAQVMLDGAIATDVSSRALEAIERQLSKSAAWQRPETRRATLEKMRSKLASLAAMSFT